MRRPSRKGLLWMFVCCANIPLTAQNLETIGRTKPFSVNGGISVNQVLYASSGISSRREPYSYFANGNVNLSLYGWIVPLSFNIADRNTSFSQPFNRYSVHPTWKWIALHAGYTSMTFSPYTVNGHVFCGGGVDLEPGKWKISALYGRYLKAVPAGSSVRMSVQPSYQRTGYGLKAGYGSGGNSIELILFRAEDIRSSIADPPDSLQVTPQENFVVSVAGSATLLKHFILKSEIASSAITKDTRAAHTDHSHWLARYDLLFKSRVSSSFYQAFKSSIDYQFGGTVMGIAYERIDPEYRTLGAYYFNNDIENVSLNASSIFLEGKLNATASAGVQHDNVDKKKISTMRRLVSSVNVNYAPSTQLNLSGSLSTFQTHTNVRSQFETLYQLTPYDNPDTLTFTQISRNASLAGMVALPSADSRKQNVTVNLSWQEASDYQGQSSKQAGTVFYNISSGYSLALAAKNMVFSVVFNTTINEGPNLSTRMMGPSASVTKSFFNRKLRTTVASSWSESYRSGANINSTVSGRLNALLSLRGNHNLSMSAVFVERSMVEALSRARELTCTVGYQYSLGTRGQSRKNRSPKEGSSNQSDTE